MLKIKKLYAEIVVAEKLLVDCISYIWCQ